jgi:DNA-binding HxlR family transcriptional regulator
MHRTRLADDECPSARPRGRLVEPAHPARASTEPPASTSFERHLGIFPTMLTRRLHGLVEHGLLRCHQYRQRPAGHEYLLTERGRGLLSALVVLAEWGRP